MRVLFLTSWYPSAAAPYSVPFVREHARALRAAGVDVAVLHVPPERVGGLRLWRFDRETSPEATAGLATYRMTSRSIRVPGLRRLGYWLDYGIYVLGAVVAVARLRRRGFRPDLIHASIFEAGAVGIVLGRVFGIPVVVTEHSTIFPRKALGPGMVKRARFAFGRAARVMPVSQALRESIEAYGIPARFEVVPNAVDAGLFHPEPNGSPEPAEIPALTATAGPQRLLFVGRLESTEHKGFSTLVEAMTLLRACRPDIHLDVVGSGESEAEQRARVEAAGLADLVTFHGSRAKPTIADMMRAASVFVLPSRIETQGVVLLEAMMCGLPVVSTRVGGIPEVVSAEDGVLVEPRDPQALAAALEAVLSGEVAFDRAGIAARATSRFSLETVGSRFTEIYADVMRERSAPGAASGRTQGPRAPERR